MSPKFKCHTKFYVTKTRILLNEKYYEMFKRMISNYCLMRGPHTHTDRQTHIRTFRLIECITQKAHALKI